MTDGKNKRIQILEIRIQESLLEIKYRKHEIERLKNEIRLLENNK